MSERFVVPEDAILRERQAASEEFVKRAVAAQMAIKEHFIAQYLAATGARIEDTQLVEQRLPNGTGFRYWCEPRT
jgi:hypothetical protein